MARMVQQRKRRVCGASKACGETACSPKARRRIKVNSDLGSESLLIDERDRQARLSLPSEHDSWYSEYFKAGVTELRAAVATSQP